MHKTIRCPPLSTYLNAIDKEYIIFPGLTTDMIRKNPPNTRNTTFGRMNTVRQNFQSTKLNFRPKNTGKQPQQFFHQFDTSWDNEDFHTDPNNTEYDDIDPHGIYYKTHTMYGDSTGQFPIASNEGHTHMILFYNADTRASEVKPLKSKAEASQAAIQYIQQSHKQGHQINVYCLDNIVDSILRTYCERSGLQLQLVPPANHRRNKAERIIQAFKNHFISILSACHTTFPSKYWYHLLPQAVVTFNLLLPSNDPSISAYEAHYKKKWDFKAIPMAPLGVPIITHDKPSERASWANHGTDGFYIGFAPEHYRCFKVLVTATNSTRITDTIDWQPDAIQLPGYTFLEILEANINKLDKTLKSVDTFIEDLAIHQYQDLQQIYYPSSALPVTPRTIQEAPLDNETFTLTNPDNSSTLVTTRLAQLPGTTRRTVRFDIPPTPDQSSTSEGAISVRPLPSEGAPNINHPIAPNSEGETSRQQTNSETTYQTRSKSTARKVMTLALIGLLHAVFKDSGGNKISYKKAKTIDLHRWQQASDDEQIRLVETLNVMQYLPHSDLPPNTKPTYFNQVCSEKRSEKGLDARVRGTLGGDRLPKTYDVTAYTSDMTTKKILLNHCVSNDHYFVVIDIKDFFVNSLHKLDSPCYMYINRADISENIIKRFNLHNLADYQNRFLVKVTGALYGHPAAARISQINLNKLLIANGYYETEIKCLWKSTDPTNQILFSTHVDDFGISTPSHDKAQELINVLEQGGYIISHKDFKGTKYCGWTIHHDRVQRTLLLTMPDYVEALLARFSHLDIDKLGGVDNPIKYTPPSYGQKIKSSHTDTSPTLSASDIKLIQEILGCVLFLCVSIRIDLATAINIVASNQSNPTEEVKAAAILILRYLKKHPNRGLEFKASDMILKCHSDASFGSSSGFRSRSGGIYYFGNKHDNMINGPVQILSSIQKTISASVAEAEYIALFDNGQNVLAIANTLLAITYPAQVPTIYTDNECAVNMANDDIKQRRTKAIDMRYHWTRHQIREQKLIIKWIQASDNLADFFTKALPTHLHLAFMNLFTVFIPP